MTTKRIVTRKGDIFCVEIDNKFKAYFQYITTDMTQLNSTVIRVFKKHYPMDYVPDFDEIVRDDVTSPYPTLPSLPKPPLKPKHEVKRIRHGVPRWLFHRVPQPDSRSSEVGQYLESA